MYFAIKAISNRKNPPVETFGLDSDPINVVLTPKIPKALGLCLRDLRITKNIVKIIFGSAMNHFLS